MTKAEFEYKKLREIKKLSLEELSKYYRQLRKYEFDSNKELESSELKKKIFFLTKTILKIERLTSFRRLIIFDDKRENITDLGKVYAASHVGRYDIESAMEAINEQAYFVMGDAEETYRNFEGFFLDNFYGRICMDTGYQIHDIFVKKWNNEPLTEEEQKQYDEYDKDRNICEVIATKRIANKDNILIYPEGAWNVTPRITQTLFPGAARMAINGNGLLVPIGILRDKKTYTVNIGKEINVSGAEESDAKEVTTLLRERMNSLVGEIIFSGDKLISRDSLGDNPEEDFIEDIMRESANGYTLPIIKATRFQDPNYPENVIGSNYVKRL